MTDEAQIGEAARTYLAAKEAEEAAIWNEIRETPQWQQLVRLRAAINMVCQLEGLPPRYPDTNATGSADADRPTLATTSVSVRYGAGAFVGASKQEAFSRVLNDRYRAAGGKPAPATVDEIHAALKDGNFAFGVSSEENAKHGIRTSMGKRPEFIRLPRDDGNDLYGMRAWYPGAKSKRPRRASGDATDGDEDESESPVAGEESPDATE
jgi:hypothetical protein